MRLPTGSLHSLICGKCIATGSMSTNPNNVNVSTDELFKSSAYLADCYLASSTKKAGEEHPMYAPFNVAFDTSLPYFEWLEKPGNEARLRRFGPAMTGTSAWEVPGAIVAGTSDAVVCDALRSTVPCSFSVAEYATGCFGCRRWRRYWINIHASRTYFPESPVCSTRSTSSHRAGRVGEFQHLVVSHSVYQSRLLGLA